MANKATADVGLKLTGTTTPKVTKPSQVPANAATDTGTSTSNARATTTFGGGTAGGGSGRGAAVSGEFGGGRSGGGSGRSVAPVSNTFGGGTAGGGSGRAGELTPTVDRTTTAPGTGTTGEPFYMGSGITNARPATQTTATGTPDTVVRMPNGQTYSAPVSSKTGNPNKTPLSAEERAAIASAGDLTTQAAINEKLALKKALADAGSPTDEETPETETETDTGGGDTGGGNTGGGDTGGGNTGGGNTGGRGGTSTPANPYPDYNPATDTAMGGYAPGSEIDRAALLSALLGDPVEADIDHINYYDRQYLVDTLNQEIDAARQQYQNSIDYGTRNAAEDLNRALRDAQGAYQIQQNQIALDERNAMDNSALYAEMRGDNGGIGRAQYDSIQNTAAQNRVSVRQAQSQLTTDTARQIADLRAQGEFEKADAMLQLTQEYLSRLQQIEQFAANYNLTVDQVNTAIDEWEAEFAAAQQKYQTGIEMSLAELTGGFSDGTPTYDALQRTNQTSAELALQLLQSGASPATLSDAQRKALKAVYGLEPSNLAAVAQLLAAASQTESGRGGRSSNSSDTTLDPNSSGDPTSLEQLQADAIRDGMEILKGSNATQQQIATITNNLEGLGATGASRDRDMWTNYGNGF